MFSGCHVALVFKEVQAKRIWFRRVIKTSQYDKIELKYCFLMFRTFFDWFSRIASFGHISKTWDVPILFSSFTLNCKNYLFLLITLITEYHVNANIRKYIYEPIPCFFKTNQSSAVLLSDILVVKNYEKRQSQSSSSYRKLISCHKNLLLDLCYCS